MGKKTSTIAIGERMLQMSESCVEPLIDVFGSAFQTLAVIGLSTAVVAKLGLDELLEKSKRYAKAGEEGIVTIEKTMTSAALQREYDRVRLDPDLEAVLPVARLGS